LYEFLSARPIRTPRKEAEMKHKTQKGQEKYEQVVTAAQEMFYRRGYERTSFSELAKASGMNRGSFYFYFPTKLDILQAVVDRRAAQLTEALQEVEAQSDSPRRRVHLYFDLLSNDHQEGRLFGCPVGSLVGETVKEDKSCLPVTQKLVDQNIEWLSDQLSPARGREHARDLALDLFARLQGAALLTAIYSDTGLLDTQIAGAGAWVDALFNETKA